MRERIASRPTTTGSVSDNARTASASERISIVSRSRSSSPEGTTSATCSPPAITATVSPPAARFTASSHDAVCLLAARSSSADTAAGCSLTASLSPLLAYTSKDSGQSRIPARQPLSDRRLGWPTGNRGARRAVRTQGQGLGAASCRQPDGCWVVSECSQDSRSAPGTRMTPRLLRSTNCLLYTSDAADEEDSVDLGGRRIIKK